jgi:hypothetical protein
MKSPREKERRREPRHELKKAVRALWGSPAGGQETVTRVNIVDVSKFGVKLRVAEKIPQGSWMLINDQELHISGRGTVRYCVYAKGMYEVGLEFPSGTGWKPPEGAV